MTDDKKEKLSDPGLAEKMKKAIDKIEEELYLKDLKYAADILDIPIDGDGNTICTETEQIQFLTFVYGILGYQEHRLKNAKLNILVDIKKRDGKIAGDLINLKLAWEE